METVNLIDYAMPLMNIERLAKETHHKCLDNDLRAAEEVALHLGVEVRILQAALALMQSKESSR